MPLSVKRREAPTPLPTARRGRSPFFFENRVRDVLTPEPPRREAV